MKKPRTTIEQVSRMLLPSRPIYILLSREIPERFRPKGALAIVGRGLDLVLRDSIGPRWQGRGAVILLNDNEIRDYVAVAYRSGPMRIHMRREAWKAAAHEVTHLALRKILPSERDKNPSPISTSAFADNLQQFCTTTPIAAAQPISWIGHGGDFIRTLFHVAHRVRLGAGEWLPSNDWLNPRQYALSSREDQYTSALGDEPTRLADVPLAEIVNIPPPEEFAKLWRADVQKWFASIENPTDEQTAALVRGLRLFSSTPIFS